MEAGLQHVGPQESPGTPAQHGHLCGRGQTQLQGDVHAGARAAHQLQQRWLDAALQPQRGGGQWGRSRAARQRD